MKMLPYKGGSRVETEWVGYSALTIANGVSDTDITLCLNPDGTINAFPNLMAYKQRS